MRNDLCDLDERSAPHALAIPSRYVVATQNPPIAADAEPTTTWHYVLSFLPNANNYLRSLRKGSLVYVEANYELRQPDPNADPNTPEGQRQIFLRHGTSWCHRMLRPEVLIAGSENIRVLRQPPGSREDADAE